MSVHVWDCHSFLLPNTHAQSQRAVREQQRGRQEATVISRCRKLKGWSGVNMQIGDRGLSHCLSSGCQPPPPTHTHLQAGRVCDMGVYQCVTADGMSRLINLCDMNTKSEAKKCESVWVNADDWGSDDDNDDGCVWVCVCVCVGCKHHFWIRSDHISQWIQGCLKVYGLFRMFYFLHK